MRKLQLSRKTVLFLLVPVLLLIVPILLPRDKLKEAQDSIAPPDAIDCGVGESLMVENIIMKQNRADADSCAVQAFKSGKPFRVRFDNHTGMGDALYGLEVGSTGIVGTSDRKIYFFYYYHSTGWLQKSDGLGQMMCVQPIVNTRKHPLTRKEELRLECLTCSEDYGPAHSDSCFKP